MGQKWVKMGQNGLKMEYLAILCSKNRKILLFAYVVAESYNFLLMVVVNLLEENYFGQFRPFWLKGTTRSGVCGSIW